MNKFPVLSRLSQGYGTWDGIAKKDPVEIDNEFFSLDELRLPPIAGNYDNREDLSRVNYKKTFDTRAFKLPAIPVPPRDVPKTYTTRKGALLLYAENYFLPGSPKAKKRRRKLKQQQSTLKLKTLTDLRDFILDYKRNGGDPLFLALLKKRLSSSSYNNNVRPGFSPKRYIATLGRSLQEESWNKLLTSGSFKDPALRSYNPYAPSFHDDGSVCELFPTKPQPYSTMSLPPISPSSSMLGSNFNFYPNGMSTGAASMISLNSEEYAPSSRAISPVESLSERLSEVEPVKRKKDNRYAMLDSKQKEQLLSQMLVQKTLETVDSDLQTWPTAFTKEDTYDSSSSLTNTQKRKNSKGSLKSSSLTSIPRLPPIQSAGTRTHNTPGTAYIPEEKTGSDVISKKISQRLSGASHHSYSSQGGVDASDQSKPSTRRPSVTGSDVFVSHHSSAVVRDDQESRDLVDLKGVEIELSDESGSHWGEALARVMDNTDDADDSQEDEDGRVLNLVKTLEEAREQENHEENDKNSEDSVDDKTTEKPLEEEGETTEETKENTETLEKQDDTRSDKVEEAAERKSSKAVSEADVEKTGEEDVENEENEKSGEGTLHSRSTTSLSIIDDQGPSPEPPPPITFEQLHSEARAVASRVLNRPQSGANFVEDARTALAMWADRLSTLLDPTPKDARTSSAAFNRQAGPEVNQRTTGGRCVPPGRKRKVSQSAGPSLAALRQALLISGGEIPGVETLKNLPPIRIPHGVPSSKHSSGVSHGSTVFEQLKGDGDARSSRASGSPGLVRSIVTERLSNSDLQMDLLNFVSDEELGFLVDRAPTAQEDESEDEDFRAALHAVVTDLEKNITSAYNQKIQSPPKAGSTTKDGPTKKKSVASPPFRVKRPVDEKPPPGLDIKNQQKARKNEKVPKTNSVPAKKGTKKVVKKGGKAAKKADKPKAEKPEKKEAPKENEKEIEENENNKEKEKEEEPELKPVEDIRVDSTELLNDISPETSIRATSEASKRLNDFSETPTIEHETISRSNSSKRSDSEQQHWSTKSPSLQSVHSSVHSNLLEQPRLVPKLPEPEEPEEDLEEKQREQERLQAELAKKKEKEARAAKRAEERAAAAERRRQEVERKRREKEEAKRKQLEEEARLEKVRQEAEEEMKRREMEMRKKREEKEAERKRKEEEEQRKEREERARIERERRQREEFERKKQELIAQRKLEEEIRKEQEKLEAEIEEANRRAEEERMLAMEESERIALQERMRREEQELRARLEAERKIQEEQRRIQEEQRKMREEAIALLRQKRLQRQLFITSLIKEGVYLSLSQRLSRAFTFSYFDKLPWGFLNNLKSLTPMKDLINEIKESIPHTIYEVGEEEAEAEEQNNN